MKKIIVITGTIASGKDLAGEILSEQLGLPIKKISDPLKAIAQEQQLELTRENLVELGSHLGKTEGDDFLAVKLCEQTDTDAMIVTGVRQLGQIDFLKQTAEAFYLLAIDADADLRFQRSQQRNSVLESSTLEHFIQSERAENTAPRMQRLFECMELADRLIYNNGSLEAFQQKIKTFGAHL